jgi:hypothetical protein
MEKTPIANVSPPGMTLSARRNRRENEEKKELDPHSNAHQFMSSQSRAGVQMSAGSSDNSDNEILSDNTVSNQSTGKQN